MDLENQNLVKLCNGFHLFHSSGGQPFVIVQRDRGRVVMPLLDTRGQVGHEFSTWLKGAHYRTYDTVLKAAALKDAVDILAAEALYHGPTEDVHLRFAKHGGTYWVFLADAEGRAVQITGDAWKIVNDPPVRFRSGSGMRPLPTPDPAGTVDLLWGAINLGAGEDGEQQRLLVLTWLLWAMLPDGPYPLLVITGGQGHGKSIMSAAIRGMIDPNDTPLSGVPKASDDFMVTAVNNPVIGLDNLSKISPELSDTLCRVATGGGIQKRQLYSDATLVHLSAKRPVIINSIGEVIERGDLADRGLFIAPPPIAPEARKDEGSLRAMLERDHPRILGGLLNLLRGALKELPRVQCSALSRMADFHRFGLAVEKATGKPAGTFAKAYEANRLVGAVAAMEAEPVAPAVLSFCKTKPDGQFTVTELLSILKSDQHSKDLPKAGWPNNAAALGARLRRLEPIFRRAYGFCMTREGNLAHSHTRLWSYWEDQKTLPADEQADVPEAPPPEARAKPPQEVTSNT